MLVEELDQRSQTRGPRAACGLREGPMRPANIRKNEDFKRNIWQIGLFSQKYWKLIEKDYYFLMRPAKPYFKSHADREAL